MLVFAVWAFTTGCGSIVGDACETQTDCGQAMFCELSMPDGYCTTRSCETDGCPDSGVCISFQVGISYCMRACESSDDCREGYACVTDFGVHPFCNDARGTSPGSAIAQRDR